MSWIKLGYASLPKSKRNLVICMYPETEEGAKRYGILAIEDLQKLIKDGNTDAFLDIVQLKTN